MIIINHSSIDLDDVYDPISADWANLESRLEHEFFGTTVAAAFMAAGIEQSVFLVHNAYDASISVDSILIRDVQQLQFIGLHVCP